MKIAFFTEGNWVGEVPRSHPNMRTDLAWQCALGSFHHSLEHPWPNKEYDVGIVIVPKTKPDLAYRALTPLKKICKKVGVMQEGPHWLWQDFKLADQINYLNLLYMVDFILCHNYIDVDYYRGLSGHNHVYRMQSLMIESSMPQKWYREDVREGVIIGGNMCRWYGGIGS